MREIKFRAWNDITERLIQWSEIVGLGNLQKLMSLNFVQVEQFTGLQDKNGVDIYEGDIVYSKQWNPSEFTVTFHEASFCFHSDKVSEYYNDPKYLETFEIIGNIHEEIK